MKGTIKVLLFAVAFAGACSADAQQLVRASNVQLVAEPGVQLVSTGGITFTGTANFNHKGSLTLFSNPISGNSDWLDSTAGGVMDALSSGHVLFRGNAALQQQIYGPTRFDTVTVNNLGVNLRQSNEVRSRLNLTNGLVYFLNQNDSLYVSNTAVTSISFNLDSINTTSFVLGKLSRRANSTAAPYYFPIGKLGAGDSLYAPLKFEKVNTTPTTWSAQYFYATPSNRGNLHAFIDHVSAVEYWEINSPVTGGDPSDDATMSMSWRTQSVVSPTAVVRDSLLIAHYFDDGGGLMWNPEWLVGNISPADVQGTVNFGWIRSNKTIADFAYGTRNFTIGTRSVNNILPVEFIDWTLTKADRSSLLRWQIADDREVDQYSIERSADGRSFVSIGSVTAVKTGGLHAYQFVDLSPVNGWNYYRIKAYNNTKQKYTAIKQLYFDNGKGSWTIFPNPASSQLTIVLPPASQQVRLRIFDAGGKLVAEKIPSGAGNVVVGLGQLASGQYYVEYSSGSLREIKPFIKL